MLFKKAALGVAALALPLTALGAAPAMADRSEGPPKHHKADDPEVQIKSDVVHVKKGKDIEVKVRYKCDTEKRRGGHGKISASTANGIDHGDDEGRLKVVLRQKNAKYSGWVDVECDNKWAKTFVELEKDSGRLKSGDANVRAVLIDPQGEKATDRDSVDVKVKDNDNHDDDDA